MNNKTKLDVFFSNVYTIIDKYAPHWFLTNLIFMTTIGQFWEHSILIQITMVVLLLFPLLGLAITLLDLLLWIYKKARFKING
ncbi:MAG: hypothetical protein ACLTDM_06955 [Clostridium butyricum]